MSDAGRFVRVNDLDLYYEERGDGAPLILIHGAFRASASWSASVPALARHYRVITPDSRGHGRTNNPAGELSYPLMADDMAAFIGALGLRKPLIAGWSDGGQIGLEMAMRYPDLAQAYVISGAFYRLTDSYRQAITALGIEAPGKLNVAALKAAFGTWNADLDSLARQLSVPFWTEPGYSAADFAQIRAPMLLLLGDRDEAVPVEQATEMYRLIPNAELAIYPGADHFFPFKQPDAFNALVLDFLRRHTAIT